MNNSTALTCFSGVHFPKSSLLTKLITLLTAMQLGDTPLFGRLRDALNNLHRSTWSDSVHLLSSQNKKKIIKMASIYIFQVHTFGDKRGWGRVSMSYLDKASPSLQGMGGIETTLWTASKPTYTHHLSLSVHQSINQLKRTPHTDLKWVA